MVELRPFQIIANDYVLFEHFLDALMLDVSAFAAQFCEACIHQLQSGQNAIRERGLY